MTINFTPRRGAILMCNFDMANVPPEMRKVRRVVVVSPTEANHRHGIGPGVCLVVPLSATPPRLGGVVDVPIPAGRYRCLSKVDVWAKCGSVTLVSHARLSRPKIGQTYPSDYLSREDMARVEAGLLAALGLAGKPQQVPQSTET